MVDAQQGPARALYGLVIPKIFETERGTENMLL